MAENEVKARMKLEEAEKKAKGGGGFLGSLFGGGKADEASDLFIQDLDDDEQLICTEQGCGSRFADSAHFEEHYKQMHRNQCAVCGLSLINAHCLELHSDEMHSPLFRVSRTRQPEALMFRCYDSSCDTSFTDAVHRNRHSECEHNIKSAFVTSQKRKIAQKSTVVDELSSDLCDLKVCAEKVKPKQVVPRTIVFGTDQSEPTFSGSQRKRRIPRKQHL